MAPRTLVGVRGPLDAAAVVSAMVRTVVAASAVVTDSVIAAALVMVEAVTCMTDVVGGIVAALTGHRHRGRGEGSDGGDRQQSLRVPRSHTVLPFSMRLIADESCAFTGPKFNWTLVGMAPTAPVPPLMPVISP